MNTRINQLVQSIFQKDSLDQCSVLELQQYADKNPYFGAAQLLLAKKMKTENHQQYNEQLQKTFLYFHNPLWVEQLLDDTGNATIIPSAKKASEEISTVTVLAPMPAEPEPVSPAGIQPSESTDETTEVANEAPLPVVSLPEEIPVQNETADPLKAGNSGNEPLGPSLPNPAFETPEPTSAGLVFEPYYTVDYFASQGIKLKEEAKPTDRFGQQLKSFTEWLKTMKKISAVQTTSTAVSQGEIRVEQLAETSLANREVLTEAMAEVWEKQGNALKAIDIYQKLSLLEPAKSTYFAARIEELKKEVK